MIVGITGLAGSGKDTAADFLVKNHGFVKVALADVLKRACKEFFAFTDEQLWGPSEKRNAIDKEIDHARISHNFAEHRLAWIDDVVPAYLLVSQAREYSTARQKLK